MAEYPLITGSSRAGLTWLTHIRRCLTHRWTEGGVRGQTRGLTPGPGKDQSGTSSATLWHNTGLPLPLLNAVEKNWSFEPFYWKGVEGRRKRRGKSRGKGKGEGGEGEEEEGKRRRNGEGGGGGERGRRRKPFRKQQLFLTSHPGAPGQVLPSRSFPQGWEVTVSMKT